MTKYSSECKLKAVLAYLNGTASFQTIATQFNISLTPLKNWVAQYKAHGKEAFSLSSYTNDDLNLKMNVLNYINDFRVTPNEAAAIFNISSPSTVYKWVELFNMAGIDALKSKKKERPFMKKESMKQNKHSAVKGSIEELEARIKQLEMENAYFKKVECLSSKQGKITKQDKAQVIYELRHAFPVKALVKLAGIPRSTYYYYVCQMDKVDRDTDLKKEIQTIYEEHEGRYGYRRIRDELGNRGKKVNHKKVQRIMRQLGLKSLVRLKKYKSYKGTVGKIAPNLLDRQFTAKAPNQKWVTDITEFKLHGEKLYLSPVLDLFNGEIITYTIGSRPTYSLVAEMVEKALEKLPEKHQLLMHSDQGWHYQMDKYRKLLQARKIRQSMSRKGNCYDNSVMENFFGIMKSEFLYLKEFESVEHFKQELEKYIEYYNTKRIKEKFKMSPVEYRTHFEQAA
ncbi:IS3 family transposase [Bacillus sp. JJ722]|uniref:IS3 family transposase n=1 Tax=Bacillus sp. JJ722 TaxID=3122973 RepID=UPI0030009A22